MTHAGTHDGTLVGLSILIATVASYTALDLAGRIHASSGSAKHAWLATAALAMGGGTWAMHFVAILAFRLPEMQVEYDLGLTAASLVLSVLATGISFYLVTWTDSGLTALIRSGLAMGAGMIGMHHTGMAALRMAADLSHDAIWIVVSISIAVGASTTALWLAFRRVGLAQKLLAAPVLGFASAGVHYAAMQGAVFTAHSPWDETDLHASLSHMSLALAIAATTFMILFLALIAAMFDRRFAILAEREAEALRESEDRYRALLEANAVVVWFATPNGMITQSHGWTSLCGQTESEYADFGWLNVLHPDDQGRVISQWQQALSSATFYQCEFRVRYINGDYRWVLASAVARKNPDGSILEWVGGVSDIHDRKLAEEKLQASEQRLRLAIETTGLGIWDVDLITGHREWTPETRQIVGVRSEATITADFFLTCIHPEDRPRVERRSYGARSTSERGYGDTYRIFRADDGAERWVTTSGRTLTDHDGKPVRRVGTIQDITHRKEAEEALRASEERLRLSLRAGRMVAWELHLGTGGITRSESSFEVLGVGSETLPDFLKSVHPEDRALVDGFIGEASRHAVGAIEFRYLRPDGATLWLGMRAEKADPERLIGVVFDISDRKIAEEELWRVANHDALTGLPNRALFQRRLGRALAEAARDSSHVSLLLVDLDHFKDVNDALGHDAGDALLKKAATHLQEMVQDCDTVARFGGDEFAIVLVGTSTLDRASELARDITRKLREPFVYAGRTFASSASIGVAAYPDHDANARDLLKDADIALYRAKAQGRNCAVIYTSSLRAAVEQRISLRHEVREALSSGHIVPFYQAKVCLSTGKVIGFEALARWLHPGKGILTPAYFGAIFDEPELAAELGHQLIARVVSDMSTWLGAGYDIGRVAINLSSAEFIQPNLADFILNALEGQNIPTRNFEVEVTETVLVGRRSDVVVATLKRLHEKGVLIALDDFGTGYASLTHLKQFPVDHVKIDRSFVTDLEQDTGDEAIVAAITGLGRSLNLQVTAEGVETEGQAQRLRGLGCHNAQGYLYGRPMSASQVPQCLSRGPAVPNTRGAIRLVDTRS